MIFAVFVVAAAFIDLSQSKSVANSDKSESEVADMAVAASNVQEQPQ